MSQALELPILPVAEAISFCNSLFRECTLRVEGEVASYSISRGKYVFFDLKDETVEAKLACFMMEYQLQFPLEDGMRIVVEAKPGLYPKSGQFRLSIQRIEAKGEGTLKRAFELLRTKLEKEGLFALERKRVLPRFVSRVGIITSPEAAGFGDFRKIAFERLPGVRYFLTPVAVQGRDAEREICQAFDYLNGHLNLDVIVLIRGGGSLEDLQAFNSEAVARCIVRSKAPVMVGVGHERDRTIADFCADVRAATPSNAAQLLVPSQEEVLFLVGRYLEEGRRQIAQRIVACQEKLRYTGARLAALLQNSLTRKQQQIERLVKTIEALSPTSVLERGFSLTVDLQKKPVSLSTIFQGQKIMTILKDGKFTSQII